MKIAAYLAALIAVMGLTGCLFGHHKSVPPPSVVDLSPSANSTAASTNKFVITPDESIIGRVASVNEGLRFVVLSFPLGQLPPAGTRMNIFRNGAIVGEVKVGTQQRDNNAVADIVLGDAQKGDEVRPK